jgi:integrase/recombinase XerD
MIAIAPYITAFFEQHLLTERRRSEQTRDSYAYAFKLFLSYVSHRLSVPPSQLALEQIDAPLVVDFLNDLEMTRHNGPSSRNARLAAIKSFMHFLEYRVPSALERIRQILAIPAKQAESRLVRHLTTDEMQAILDAPDPTRRSGVRDRAMLHLCYAAGLRVSELIALRVDNLTLQPHASVLILGKGRRERCLPLWKTTTTAVRAWLAIRGPARVPELFITGRGDAFTRSGFDYILAKHVKTATHQCPMLATKRISPHVVRHTCALTILQATKDLRKVSLWLGHAHLHTTEIYTRADPSVKLEALESVVPPNLRSGRFKATDGLIASLMSRPIMQSETRSR